MYSSLSFAFTHDMLHFLLYKPLFSLKFFDGLDPRCDLSLVFLGGGEGVSLIPPHCSPILFTFSCSSEPVLVLDPISWLQVNVFYEHLYRIRP